VSSSFPEYNARPAERPRPDRAGLGRFGTPGAGIAPARSQGI